MGTTWLNCGACLVGLPVLSVSLVSGNWVTTPFLNELSDRDLLFFVYVSCSCRVLRIASLLPNLLGCKQAQGWVTIRLTLWCLPGCSTCSCRSFRRYGTCGLRECHFLALKWSRFVRRSSIGACYLTSSVPSWWWGWLRKHRVYVIDLCWQ